MKSFSLKTLGFGAALAVCWATHTHASITVVTPGNMDGWAFYSTDSSAIVGTGTATTGMVNGPATPPSGTGSAHLMTGAGAGDGSAQLRNSVLPGFPGGFWLAETEVTGLEPPKTLGTGVLGPSTAGRRELRLKAPRPARLVRGRMSMDSRRKAALRRLAGAAARKHWRPLNFGSARIANEQSPGDS